MTSPTGASPIRWGILGTGGIAATFATDLALLPEAEVVAVGSRRPESSQAFARRFHVPRHYASYADLVEDDEVDAVYVATPHPVHAACALLAIRAGKAVLVEKPFTLNGSEARELVTEAEARGTFLMEAMWTRFLPHVVRVRELIAAGRLGDVRSLVADFGERFAPVASHRSFAPELGGGALLDLGVYPISFASMLFGSPLQVVALSSPAFTGVDAQTGVVLLQDGGRVSSLFTTLETNTASRASINGTEARIEITDDFFAPAHLRIVDRSGRAEVVELAHQGRGLRHQADEVGRCLRAGLTESPVLPPRESLAIMDTLDEIRRQIGLRYPSDLEPAALPS